MYVRFVKMILPAPRPKTGVLDCPTIANTFYCTECDWYEGDNPELISEIVKLNSENNTL